MPRMRHGNIMFQYDYWTVKLTKPLYSHLKIKSEMIWRSGVCELHNGKLYDELYD